MNATSDRSEFDSDVATLRMHHWSVSMEFMLELMLFSLSLDDLWHLNVKIQLTLLSLVLVVLKFHHIDFPLARILRRRRP